MPEAGELRRVPLLIAVALIFVVVALELGAAGFLRGAGDAERAVENVRNSSQFKKHVLPRGEAEVQRTLAAVRQAAEEDDPPGLGIPYLALVDGILAYSLLLVALGLIVPERLQGKVQGIVTLILSILLLIGSIVLILLALAKLLLMIALFFSVPFGTIAYMALWGTFPKAGAAVVLSIIMLLKVASAVCLPIAHQRFLENKGLILLFATSLVATIIVSFLHGLVPFALVSITDAVAAIVVGILAVIWAIVLIVGSVISVVQAITTT
jgi:hypothetical protein